MFFILISLLMFFPGLFSPSFAMKANLEVVNQDIFSKQDLGKLFQFLQPKAEQKKINILFSGMFNEKNPILLEDHTRLPQSIHNNIQTIPELLQAFAEFQQKLTPEESSAFNALYGSIITNFSALDWYDGSQEIYKEATKKIQSQKWCLLFDQNQYLINTKVRSKEDQFVGYILLKYTPDPLDMYRVFLSLHLIKNNLSSEKLIQYLSIENLDDQQKEKEIFRKINPKLNGIIDQKMINQALKAYKIQ